MKSYKVLLTSYAVKLSVVILATALFILVKGVNAKTLIADNGYFKAQVGTYWIYEGQGREMKEGRIDNYRIKVRYEVVSVSGKAGDYILKIKTTNLLDKSVREGSIILKKDYIIFNIDEFYNYVRFPLKVGSRWEEVAGDVNTEPLRADGYYQNRINWKLTGKVIGNDCYNIVYKTLPDTSQTLWCSKIGPAQGSYHHNGSLMDSFVRLTGYHF